MMMRQVSSFLFAVRMHLQTMASVLVAIGVRDDRNMVFQHEQIYKGSIPQRYKCGLLFKQGDLWIADNSQIIDWSDWEWINESNYCRKFRR